MSAIVGIFHPNNNPIEIEHGSLLMSNLRKYSADDIQIWQKSNIFLGCHAQWITPESVGEMLPYYDSERKLAITSDAIIDNREELFERLQIKNNYRKSITDSELILLSYYKWEEECPKYLIGDFAFMIWDERKQKLFGARDISGYRTLYYFQNPSRFVFCTTIEPILSLPYVNRKLNEQWLAEYLTLTGMIDTLDAVMTPYQNINQIPPGHSISVSAEKMNVTRFGTLYSKERLKLSSNEEYVEAFQDVFQTAVNARLRTHRKIGSQLSGGLDSGSVVGFAAKKMREENKILHTFSYVPPSDFDDFTHKRLMPNESPLIKSTVDYVGGIAPHYLEFEGRSSYSEIDSFLDVMEMPYKFFENSFWLGGMFEEAYRQGIGVLLNGDSGNWTISWGIAEDYYAILLKKLKWIHLYKELDQYCRKVGGPRLGRLPLIAKISFPFINQIIPERNTYKLPLLLNPRFSERTGIKERLKERGIGENGWISISNIYKERRGLFENMFPWNAGNTFNSKLSLRYSLWKRDPTHDLRVVRFCLSLPDDQFVQGGLDRALIRRATKDILPDEVRLNQTIRGVQGVDWVYRMRSSWDTFIEETTKMSKDNRCLEFLNGDLINNSLSKAKQGPQSSMAFDADYKTLMRSLIVYRFIKTFN